MSRWQVTRFSLYGCGPHLECQPSEIDNANIFDDEEQRVKAFCHKAKTEHRRNEPGQLADPHGRKKRQHTAHALVDHARD
jgi:hypothetical protein